MPRTPAEPTSVAPKGISPAVADLLRVERANWVPTRNVLQWRGNCPLHPEVPRTLILSQGSQGEALVICHKSRFYLPRFKKWRSDCHFDEIVPALGLSLEHFHSVPRPRTTASKPPLSWHPDQHAEERIVSVLGATSSLSRNQLRKAVALRGVVFDQAWKKLETAGKVKVERTKGGYRFSIVEAETPESVSVKPAHAEPRETLSSSIASPEKDPAEDLPPESVSQRPVLYTPNPETLAKSTESEPVSRCGKHPETLLDTSESEKNVVGNSFLGTLGACILKKQTTTTLTPAAGRRSRPKDTENYLTAKPSLSREAGSGFYVPAEQTARKVARALVRVFTPNPSTSVAWPVGIEPMPNPDEDELGFERWCLQHEHLPLRDPFVWRGARCQPGPAVKAHTAITGVDVVLEVNCNKPSTVKRVPRGAPVLAYQQFDLVAELASGRPAFSPEGAPRPPRDLLKLPRKTKARTNGR